MHTISFLLYLSIYLSGCFTSFYFIYLSIYLSIYPTHLRLPSTLTYPSIRLFLSILHLGRTGSFRRRRALDNHLLLYLSIYLSDPSPSVFYFNLSIYPIHSFLSTLSIHLSDPSPSTFHSNLSTYPSIYPSDPSPNTFYSNLSIFPNSPIHLTSK